MTRQAKQGFTLVEMMMAAAITTVIGLAVAGVASALSQNYQQNRDYYSNVANARTGLSLMRESLLKAKLVPACSDNELVIWLDSNGDGDIQTSEVRYWAISNGDLQELRVVYPPQRQGMDSKLNLSQITSTSAARNLLSANAYKDTSPLANNATSFDVGVEPDAPQANFVKLNLCCGSGSTAISLRTAVQMRADYVSRVSKIKGAWVLGSSDE